MRNNINICKTEFSLLIIASILASTPSSGQWIRRADAPQYRSDLSESIIYKSQLYTFLGFYDHDRHADSTADGYEPVTNTYILLAPLPGYAAMTHEKVVLIDSTVWLIGGRVGQNPGPLTSETLIYNIITNTWSKGPQLIDPATGDPILWAAGGAALLGRTLHLFGGFIINACNHDQSIYHLTLDVDSWLSDTTKPADWKNDLQPLPIKRNHFSTVVLGGKIYALGGQFGHDCGGGQEKPYSHVYDPATDTWAELPSMPNARSHAEGASFALDGKIFMVGGQDENGASTDKVLIFDPAANNGAGRWEDDSALTLPGRYEGGTSKIINSTFIYSHGGEKSSAHPKKETYTRTIIRNPIYKLEFSSGCLNLNADSGTSVKSKTLLFTIDSSKSYTTFSSADWLIVNKNATGIATQNAVDIEITANTAGLSPGEYNGTITAKGLDNDPKFIEATYCVSLTVKSVYPHSQKLEAEAAQLNGVIVSDDHAGFSGTGFGNYINLSGDYIEWSINKSVEGPGWLSFRYSNGKENDRPLQLSVNGVGVDSALSFPSTGTWTNWSTVNVVANLDTGINTVRLTAIGYSGPNVDYLFYANDTSSIQKASMKNNIIAKSTHVLKDYIFPNPVSANATLTLNTCSKPQFKCWTTNTMKP